MKNDLYILKESHLTNAEVDLKVNMNWLVNCI